VSKYDLDRKTVNMEKAKHEKHMRRVVNAKVKRDLINNEVKQEKFAEVVTKIGKIRDVTRIKQ
jgi:hypothetical protein